MAGRSGFWSEPSVRIRALTSLSVANIIAAAELTAHVAKAKRQVIAG